MTAILVLLLAACLWVTVMSLQIVRATIQSSVFRRVRWGFGGIYTIPECHHHGGNEVQEITIKIGTMAGPLAVQGLDASGQPEAFNGVIFSSSGPNAELLDVAGVEGVPDGKYIACRASEGDETITAEIDPTEAPDDVPVIAPLTVHAVADHTVVTGLFVGLDSLQSFPIPAGL